ncbi:MAG: hypothetical protein ACRDV1_03690 [Actinomycetes bacterium]
MTTPEFDPVGLLDVLNRHGVGYVVIGGFAAVAYGSPLPTADIDITPAPGPDNLARLSNALRDLDARVRVDGVDEGLAFAHNAESLRAVTVLNLLTRLGPLDLVVRPAGGADYEALAERQLVVTLHGVTVPLASFDDIIASKEAAGRPKDRQALPLLRALRDRLAGG